MGRAYSQHTWWSEDSLLGRVGSLHYVGPGAWTQDVRPGNRHLHSLATLLACFPTLKLWGTHILSFQEPWTLCYLFKPMPTPNKIILFVIVIIQWEFGEDSAIIFWMAFREFSTYIFIYIYLSVSVHIPCHMCGSQRTTWRSLFSPCDWTHDECFDLLNHFANPKWLLF